ncbi:peroxiredoxin [Sphingomonas naphthae]|uniref:thioredoxin-dependent peroxiredoxin n=1 Tax=Sphingomonas naphthae TaxID=1813468 RepID=A0ABY7TKA1_9SPHN|nr:peroxiredoxin [Sphingomonas naphthae]WCT73373.1 peroxiredoxin [Sphingomonas naphthae]
MIQEGDAAPNVTLIAADGSPMPLAGVAKPLVLYFYPKDDTTGCTKEAQAFSNLADDFAGAGVSLLGVSRDSPKSHAKFTAKYDLRVPLATDDESVSTAFGSWVEKQMYGRTYMGMERSTFLIDADGRIAKAWRKVKVAGHAEAVLEAARGLGAKG